MRGSFRVLGIGKLAEKKDLQGCKAPLFHVFGTNKYPMKLEYPFGFLTPQLKPIYFRLYRR